MEQYNEGAGAAVAESYLQILWLCSDVCCLLGNPLWHVSNYNDTYLRRLWLDIHKFHYHRARTMRRREHHLPPSTYIRAILAQRHSVRSFVPICAIVNALAVKEINVLLRARRAIIILCEGIVLVTSFVGCPLLLVLFDGTSLCHTTPKYGLIGTVP